MFGIRRILSRDVCACVGTVALHFSCLHSEIARRSLLTLHTCRFRNDQHAAHLHHVLFAVLLLCSPFTCSCVPACSIDGESELYEAGKMLLDGDADDDDIEDISFDAGDPPVRAMLFP